MSRGPTCQTIRVVQSVSRRAVVDTNTDPDPVAHVIPCNDDAIRSVKLIVNAVIKINLILFSPYLGLKPTPSWVCHGKTSCNKFS